MNNQPKVDPDSLPPEEKEARAKLSPKQRRKADRLYLKAQGLSKPRLKKLLRRRPSQ